MPHLRIAIFSDAQPERNGVATYYRDLAGQLQARGERVEFLCPGHGDPPLTQWMTLPLPGDRTQRLALPSVRALRQRLESFRPDVVVAATPGPYGLLAARHAHHLGARVVFGLHTDYEALSSLYWGMLRGQLGRWSLAAANRRLLASADRVVAISPRMQALAERAGRPDVQVLSTQLPAAFVDTPTSPRDGPLTRVIYVGRLAAEKRIDQVIEAAERLPAIRFAIAGEGPLRKTVEAAAARQANLDYLGWQPRAEVRAAIDCSDLLLLPSLVEAFGTVALEALARERLALASAGCGIHDWPELGGGLLRYAEHEHPADAIARIAALDPEARQHAARQGRAAALAMHDRAVAQWLTVLGDDAGAPAPAGAIA